MHYDLDFLRRMQGGPAEAADEIERLRGRAQALEKEWRHNASVIQGLRDRVRELEAAVRLALAELTAPWPEDDFDTTLSLLRTVLKDTTPAGYGVGRVQ